MFAKHKTPNKDQLHSDSSIFVELTLVATEIYPNFSSLKTRSKATIFTLKKISTMFSLRFINLVCLNSDPSIRLGIVRIFDPFSIFMATTSIKLNSNKFQSRADSWQRQCDVARLCWRGNMSNTCLSDEIRWYDLAFLLFFFTLFLKNRKKTHRSMNKLVFSFFSLLIGWSIGQWSFYLKLAFSYQFSCR